MLSSNSGEICLREVGYLPLNLSKHPFLGLLALQLEQIFTDYYETWIFTKL